jgi:hypothetical protein
VCICAVSGWFYSWNAIARAQQPDQFRTVFAGFSINLPANYSEYKFASTEIARYKFPARMYRWNSDHDAFTIYVGEGTNDLEKPEYTKLFFDDLRNQHLQHSQKENGVIIDDAPWSFEGHPGWQLLRRYGDVVLAVRSFVIGYRFYAINLSVFDGQGVNETRQKILDSFHLLSIEEIAEEKERLIKSFAPPALPQQPTAKRPLSDAEEENLHGSVKRVYVEEADYLGKPKPGAKHPRLREDFDREGYLVAKVQYRNFVPYRLLSYGYVDGNRAYLLHEPVMVEQLASSSPKPAQTPQLFKLEYRYGKNGKLEELKVLGDKGVVEKYSYQNKPNQLEIAFSARIPNAKELSVNWKSILQLDKDGNAITETKMDYVAAISVLTANSISVEKQVDSYAVVSNAIRGESVIPANGAAKAPSVGDVARNPNMTQRVIEPTGSSAPLAVESSYSYEYEYDSQGNWITRSQSLVKTVNKMKTAAPIKVTYRTITYY